MNPKKFGPSVEYQNIKKAQSFFEVLCSFLSRVPLYRTMLISTYQVHTCASFYILQVLWNKQKMGQLKAQNPVACIVWSYNKSDAPKILKMHCG